MTDRLVRVASGRAIGTSITVTFTEGAALDNTHLLVAVVAWASSTVPTTPSGWTESPGGGSNGTTQVRVYARRGDGTVNSFSITGASAAKTVYLMGYSGFVSATAAEGEGQNPSATAGAMSLALTSPPNVQGVIVGAAYQGGVIADGSWDNGYTLTGTYPASGAIHPGRKVYSGPSGSYSTTYTNTSGVTSGLGRAILVVYELV